MNNLKLIGLIIIFTAFMQTFAQGNEISWKRTDTEYKPKLHLFHSIEAVNLPTTETLQKGDIQFEISHRFLPTINSGSKTLYGFDGPVNIKLSLGYAFTDKMITTIMRSNLNDNVILNTKYQLFDLEGKTLPSQFAAEGGIAWNTGAFGRNSSHNMNFQYYGQLIFNTLINKKLGIGLVPSFIYNTDIYLPKKENSFMLGSYVQYYISHMVSVIAEGNTRIAGYKNQYNSFTFGVELETGGHFFKIILTNNASLNPTQYPTGADLPISAKNWRIGFNITRLL